MTDVALYGHWICPFSTRVEFALHQRRVDHELVDLPPLAVRGRNAPLPPEFVEHSPRLEIPMVRIGDEYLADSIPILLWIEDEFDQRPLVPTGADALLVRERMEWIDSNVFPPMVGIYYGTEPDRIGKAGDALAGALAEMAGWAESTGWLAGDTPTLAEAVAVPVYVRMEGLRSLGFTSALDPAVEAHMDRCRQLGGWSAVEWSDEQVDEFVGRFDAYRRKRGDG